VDDVEETEEGADVLPGVDVVEYPGAALLDEDAATPAPGL